MRVLYLCHRIPYPPDKGDKIRAFYQLKALSARHEVDVFTLVDDPRDLAGRQPLQAYCRSLTVATVNPTMARLRSLPSLLSARPLTLPYFYSRTLAQEVRQALKRRSYDRVFVYCSAMAQYVDERAGIPMLTDLVDVDSDKWVQYAAFTGFPLSAVYRREGRALRAYEKKICETSLCVIVTTEREARLVRQISDVARIYVITNGVDTTYFAPQTAPVPDSETPTITFTGDMSYFPNQEAVGFFARSVLPLIRKSVPNTRFLVVGRNPSGKVRDLERIGGIEVTGYVPDVRAYLAKTSVSVAPFSIASGIQNKILEAMACGLPIVATKRAVQGLSVGVAEVITTADGAIDMAAKIVGLLEDGEMRRRQGSEGRCRVISDYSWERSQGLLLQLLDDCERPGLLATPAQSSLV